MFARRVEFELDVLVTRADTRVNTLVLGILQRLNSHVDVVFYSSRQRTNRGPSNGLRNLNHRVVVTRTRHRKSCFNHVHAQLLQSLRHLNLLNRIQLAAWHLFAVSQRRVKNKQSVIHLSLIICVKLLLSHIM